jgi:hypothetical protein
MAEKKIPSKRKSRVTAAPIDPIAKKPAARKKIAASAPRKASSKRTSVSAVVFNVSDAEIARKAYHLWEERGRPFGSPDVDWANAVAQLRPS